MSYLAPLRLHFAGRFQANIPTGNNLVRRARRGRHLGYNPQGDGAWRLLGCRITAAFDREGRPVSRRDGIFRLHLADSDRLSPAKIVDLDPQQPMAPTLFGLELRLCDRAGRNRVRGCVPPTTLNHFYQTRTLDEEKEDGAEGAFFQSVLTELEWKSVHGSRWLRQLKQAVEATGRISIRFNVDSYVSDYRSPDFATGRIVGTLGPALRGEPKQFVLGRHLLWEDEFQGAVALVDRNARKVRLDLGNTLKVASHAGPFADIGEVSLRCRAARCTKPTLDLGTIDYLGRRWFEKTAGIVELPIGRLLTTHELNFIESNPIELWRSHPTVGDALMSFEPDDGLFVRADDCVFRMEPEKSAALRLYATRFGRPAKGATLAPSWTPEHLRERPGGPKPGEPRTALKLPTAKTDPKGYAEVELTPSDPGRPRGFIDGQVYCFRYHVAGSMAQDIERGFCDMINVRVWSAFRADASFDWDPAIKDIFRYYKLCFPIMDRFVDLTDLEEVKARRRMLLMVFSLPETDPNYMPTTRDLSPAVREAIVAWLKRIPDPEPDATKSLAEFGGPTELPAKTRVKKRHYYHDNRAIPPPPQPSLKGRRIGKGATARQIAGKSRFP